MRTTVVWGSLLLLACTGCSAQQSIIRGQNPSGGTGAIQQAFAEFGATDSNRIQPINYAAPVTATGWNHGHGAYGPPSHCPPAGHGYCPPGHGHCPPGHCPPGHCMHGVLGHLCTICHPLLGHLHGWPWHRTTHSYSDRYNDPHEFVYPPAHQPPAVVQYPYYTLRGPTDFFMP